MIAARLAVAARRFTLPAACLLLAVMTTIYGETVLSDLAGHPTVGTLSAETAARLLAAAFAVMCIVTSLMATFPGTHPRDTSSEETAMDEILEHALVNHDDQPIVTRRGKHAADVPEEIDEIVDPSSSTIIAALKQAAAAAANARLVAEERAAAAEARATAAEERLQGLHDGTSPEAHALVAHIRQEVSRDALAEVTELSETSDRLVASLKEAITRTEAELDAARQRAVEEIADLRAAHAAEIAATREQATLGEYERIKTALLALNRTHADVLDPMQREAVERHQQRLVDAFGALDDAHRNVVLPAVPRPALAADESATLANNTHVSPIDETPPPAPSPKTRFKIGSRRR